MEGIDEAGVSAWLTANVVSAEPPFQFELIAGGRSNLTFQVTDASGQRLALRRPPVSHVLPTAHDMAREHRIISALGPTAVPVPEALGLCIDPSVTGAPFYVMRFVDGHILRDQPSAARELGEGARRRAGESLAEVLAAIHGVDVDSAGLGELSRRDGYIDRQLKRWHTQVQRSREESGQSTSLVEELYCHLAARVPEQVEGTIVHGDYRLDNTVLAGDGRVRAVLDWELCTLGDPRADLGLLMVYWAEAGDAQPPLGLGATTLAGFPSRSEMISLYRSFSGRDAADLEFFVAFGYWKLACIVEGVLARYVGGAAGGDRSGMDALRDNLDQLARAAQRAAEALG